MLMMIMIILKKSYEFSFTFNYIRIFSICIPLIGVPCLVFYNGIIRPLGVPTSCNILHAYYDAVLSAAHETNEMQLLYSVR
jgi:hypothetical protein